MMLAAGPDSKPINTYLTAGIAVCIFVRDALKMKMPSSVISRYTGSWNDRRLLRYYTDLSRELIKGDSGI